MHLGFWRLLLALRQGGAVQPRGPGKALGLLHIHAWGECQRSRRHVDGMPRKLSGADMILARLKGRG